MSGYSMEQQPTAGSRGTRRTIIDAFGRLVLRRQPRTIRVADVIAEARVGRSTFYDHFSSAEQVHMAALRGPFAVLADAAAGRGNEAATEALLRHFWENRGRARASLEGRPGEGALRVLADMVAERLEGPLIVPPEMAARQLAASAIGAIAPWLLGEVSTSPAALATALCRGGVALSASLRQPG